MMDMSDMTLSDAVDADFDLEECVFDADDLSCAGLRESVNRVADDLGVPRPDVYESRGSLGEFNGGDPRTRADDSIGADSDFVRQVNSAYGDPRAYDVIVAHEMGHAKIDAAGLRSRLTPHAQERVADTAAGLYAGAHGLSRGVYEDLIGKTAASESHPAGYERVGVFNRAYDLANGYVYKDFIPITKDPTRRGEISELYEDAIFGG